MSTGKEQVCSMMWGISELLTNVKKDKSQLNYYLKTLPSVTSKFISYTKMKKNLQIREIRKDVIGKLEDILYEATYQRDEQNPIPRSVLKNPEVNVYIKDFGKKKSDY